MQKKELKAKTTNYSQELGNWIHTCKEYAGLLWGPDTFLQVQNQ